MMDKKIREITLDILTMSENDVYDPYDEENPIRDAILIAALVRARIDLIIAQHRFLIDFNSDAFNAEASAVEADEER
jgi:hypothetical protein